MHLADEAADMPLHPDMQRIRNRGNPAPWPDPRTMARRPQAAALPPVGRKRLRSRAMKLPFADIHTHIDTPGAIINIAPGAPMLPGRHYSVGIHPWDIDLPELEARMRAVELAATNPQVVMIGETGVDLLRATASTETQMAVLRRHAALAEHVGKPLLLHVVRAWEHVIGLRRELAPSQTWIIHGFRGKPELALRLLREGFDISLGRHFNPATEAIIPADRLHRETDATE